MLAEEHALLQQGFTCIAGLDEVGRGCWAGPVVAAAVVFPPFVLFQPQLLEGINDSKTLTPAQRLTQVDQIKHHAVGIGIGATPAFLIDLFGIALATRWAMLQALLHLPQLPDALLLDWISLKEVALPQRSFPKGDQRSISIAAASIIAKVHRDTLMQGYGFADQRYGWEKHKGYGTPLHQATLATHGVSHLHRRSFRPVAALLQSPPSQ